MFLAKNCFVIVADFSQRFAAGVSRLPGKGKDDLLKGWACSFAEDGDVTPLPAINRPSVCRWLATVTLSRYLLCCKETI
jgi:hypothetical protein